MARVRAVLVCALTLTVVGVTWVGYHEAPDRSSVAARVPSTTITTVEVTTTPTTLPPPTTAMPRASRGGHTRPTQAPVFAEVDGMPGLLRRIGGCESSGDPDAPINWTAQNKHSSASGGFQIIDSTWASWTEAYAPDIHGKYAKARYAAPEEQLRVARAAFERQGTGPWKSSQRCWR